MNKITEITLNIYNILKLKIQILIKKQIMFMVKVVG